MNPQDPDTVSISRGLIVIVADNAVTQWRPDVQIRRVLHDQSYTMPWHRPILLPNPQDDNGYDSGEDSD